MSACGRISASISSIRCQREAKAIPGIGALNASSYVVRTTINPQLQRATESILQEGLARYELNTGRYKFQGPEANLSDAIQALTNDKKLTGPAWLAALKAVRLPLYDVHWEPAVVVENGRTKKGDVINVGIADGRILPLNTWNANIRRTLKVNDVVYVRVREAAQKQAARAELRIRPTVQGAVLVMENKTGRLLAMAGAFSYPDSQLNRAVQSVRQPGSTLKPLTYLTALQKGLQPNTLVMDAPITLPPIGGQPRYARPKDYWSPKNADGGGAGVVTMRRGAGGFAQSRDRQSDGERHRGQRRSAGSTGSASLRWKRSSTSNAAASIPSCSARSRCG